MNDVVDIKMEEYIPLKIIFNKDEEVVDNISYSKDNTSVLEFMVGMKNKTIKRITLLLCKEYSETLDKLEITCFDERKIDIHIDDVKCSVFYTILYSDGAKIVLSDQRCSHYIKMDKVFWGLSDTDDIVEICVCNMSDSELEHLKNELAFQ